jgi:hypothetical protein
MEFPARNVRMLHNTSRKSKGENHADIKDLHARNDASKTTAGATCRSRQNQLCSCILLLLS